MLSAVILLMVLSSFFRSPYEKIQQSKKVAEDFILDSLPGFYIKSVSGDGYCIIHSFVEALKALGHNVTFNTVSSSLRTELQKEQYREASLQDTNITEAFDEFMKNPLSNYDQDITDMFFEALTMAYQVNVIVFQSAYLLSPL